MPIGDFHASHIRKVWVAFDLEAPLLDPDVVTRALGISPSRSARQGGERRNFKGNITGIYERGWWQLSTESVISSKDVNDHFHDLLERLLPHREAILGFAEGGETYFGVLWKSTYLYAGTGPLLDARSIRGAAALGAGMGFDIYQVEEDS